MSARVVGDDAIPGREAREDVLPVFRTEGRAVREHDGRLAGNAATRVVIRELRIALQRARTRQTLGHRAKSRDRLSPVMAARTRLDQLLVQRSLAPSRERAQALILAGAVRVDGEVADRAAAPVSDAAAITIDGGPRFVSRGGEKLDAALDELGIDVSR